MKTSLTLPMELWQQAKIRAVQERRDLQDVIASALEAYLKTAAKKAGGAR